MSSRNQTMFLLRAVIVSVVLLGISAVGQNPPTSDADDRMAVPQPVSVDGGSLEFTSETRSNYLKGGVAFTTAYDDNILAGAGHSPSDVSYSVYPNIGVDITRPRLHWNLKYQPGFTFYQRYSSLNQSDHDLSVDLSYRLSPHVTMSLTDDFSRRSTVLGGFGQTLLSTGSGSLQQPNQSVVAPISDHLDNTAGGQLTYQFTRNGMIGFTGNSSELRYLSNSNLQGLFDSSVRGGGAFYNHRLSRKHYIGVNYQFQDFLALPNQSETQTHSIFGFYTLFATPSLSFAFFGGPQHSTSSGAVVLAASTWSPGGGVTINWQGVHTSLVAGLSRRVNDGGGLQGAVESSSANVSLRRQLTRFTTFGIGGAYSNNEALSPIASFAQTNGHSISGNALLDLMLSRNLGLQFGYTKIHQTYSNIPALSAFPNRNRAWVSISYQFERPLGR